MHVSRRPGTTHQCTLAKGSDSCLPKLPPQASKIKRWMREFHKSIMVSSKNTNSKFFFRSRAAIFLERKRHMRSSFKYIIHPFSKICIKREIIMCLLWLYAFFKDPFTIAFYTNNMATLRTQRWIIMNILVDLTMTINIGISFITGTHEIQTKEVILEPKKIAKHYILTYFFFDFFGSVPFYYLTDLFFPMREKQEIYYTLLACLHFLRFVRIKTTLEYFRRITRTFGFEDTTHQLICLVLLSLYLLHWWACLLYIIPRLESGLSNDVLGNTSWVVMAHIEPTANVTLGRKYLECLLQAFCHFYRAGTGMYITKEPSEQIMFSFAMISGIFFTSYVIVVVLQMVSSASASESKYEELVNQLKEYARRKKLPLHIRKRLLLYYENRFQKHYFKEQAILNTLSDHLRYEIFLHSCKGLVDKVSLFQGLSKSTVGSIVGYLKPEVFLSNDVIMKASNEAECIYFISYGTVAYMLPSGKEFCHLEDGDHFGEVPFFVSNTSDIGMGNVIALEITEVFRLEKRDLHHCVFQDEEIGERLEKIATDRLHQMETLETEEIYDEGKKRRDVLHELRKGKILEHSHHKRRK